MRATPRSTLFPYTTLFRSLGLAFLSKYFAVLLGLAYVAYVAFSPRGQRDWRALALVVLCSLPLDRKSTRLNSSHLGISYAVFCLKKKNYRRRDGPVRASRT